MFMETCGWLFSFLWLTEGMWSNHKNCRHGQVYCNGKHWKQEEEEVVCSFLFTCKVTFPMSPRDAGKQGGNTFFFLSVVGLTVDSACEKTNQAWSQTDLQGRIVSRHRRVEKKFWGIQVPMSTVACIIREWKKFHHVKQNSVVWWNIFFVWTLGAMFGGSQRRRFRIE